MLVFTSSAPPEQLARVWHSEVEVSCQVGTPDATTEPAAFLK
jgi:hypothetical protein